MLRAIPSRHATARFLAKIAWKSGGEVFQLSPSEELIDKFQAFMVQEQPRLVRELVAEAIERRKREYSQRPY